MSDVLFDVLLPVVVVVVVVFLSASQQLDRLIERTN